MALCENEKTKTEHKQSFLLHLKEIQENGGHLALQDKIEVCRVDETYDKKSLRLSLRVTETWEKILTTVITSLTEQHGASRARGGAPPNFHAREIQKWLNKGKAKR